MPHNACFNGDVFTFIGQKSYFENTYWYLEAVSSGYEDKLQACLEGKTSRDA